MTSSCDVVCIGGGIVGLATAYELALQNVRVTVLDKGPLGGVASWAGAGIISPPPSESACRTAFDKLRRYSYDRMAELAEQLLDETGIDAGYRKSGALELARDLQTEAELVECSMIWRRQGVEHQPLSKDEISEKEPHLDKSVMSAFYLPQACQVRNPRMLKALQQACSQRNVQLLPRHPVRSILLDQPGNVQLELMDGSRMEARHVVVTAGAWSSRLLAGVGFETFPVKGQIVTFQTQPDAIRSIVHLGKRYLVPRSDGLVLVGATEEPGLFDVEVTAEAAGDLRDFALNLFPVLKNCPSGPMWAGLRPAARPAGPVIGPLPADERVWIATGHFRQGLQFSPGTARLVADGILGRSSFASVSEFAWDADRHQFESGFHS